LSATHNLCSQLARGYGMALTEQTSPNVGQVKAFTIEHTFVSALIPYDSYRGAVRTNTGKQWVPMMPAITTYQFTASQVLARTNFDAVSFISQFLRGSLAQPANFPLDALRAQLSGQLASGPNPVALQTLVGMRWHATNPLSIVPATTPLKILAVTTAQRQVKP
jgi:hypothetical protein